MNSRTIEAEKQVIGNILSWPSLKALVADIKPELFTKEMHVKAVEAMCELFNEGLPVDTVAVVQRIQKHLNGQMDTRWVGELSRLSTDGVRPDSVQTSILYLKEQVLRKKLISISSECSLKALDERNDIFELFDHMATEAINATNQLGIRSTRSAKEIAREVKNEVYEVKAGRKIAAYPTGFHTLDEIIGGLRPGELTILAARPGMGKTALAIQIAHNWLQPSGFLSFEMVGRELVRRIISSLSGHSSNEIISGNITADDLEAAADRVSAEMYINDKAGMGLAETIAEARSMKIKHKIGILVVDYLQLVDNHQRGVSTNDAFEQVAYGLKKIAKDLDIPVIALSQLSREVERRSDKRPNLSDLRSSGGIEQAADAVWFIYRPEYYEILEDELGESTKGIAEVLIEKNRHGEIGKATLGWQGKTTTFYNITREIQINASNYTDDLF